ncbi:hypothetical protein PInf_016394 [Phytophthora infestans]|nr:hypothetical protein PInf_016394 [Phytophthora infestans]
MMRPPAHRARFEERENRFFGVLSGLENPIFGCAIRNCYVVSFRKPFIPHYRQRFVVRSPSWGRRRYLCGCARVGFATSMPVLASGNWDSVL